MAVQNVSKEIGGGGREMRRMFRYGNIEMFINLMVLTRPAFATHHVFMLPYCVTFFVKIMFIIKPLI